MLSKYIKQITLLTSTLAVLAIYTHPAIAQQPDNSTPPATCTTENQEDCEAKPSETCTMANQPDCNMPGMDEPMPGMDEPMPGMDEPMPGTSEPMPEQK
jgi:hypothetical protein